MRSTRSAAIVSRRFSLCVDRAIEIGDGLDSERLHRFNIVFGLQFLLYRRNEKVSAISQLKRDALS